jgi:hypothetical protein
MMAAQAARVPGYGKAIARESRELWRATVEDIRFFCPSEIQTQFEVMVRFIYEHHASRSI